MTRRRAATSARFRGRQPIGPVVWPVLMVAVALALVLPLGATGKPILYALSLVFVAFLVVLGTLGLERTGGLVVVLGVVAAPMTAVVLPGASFVTVSDLCFVIGFGMLTPAMLASPLRLSTPFVVGSAGIVIAGILASLLSVQLLGSMNLQVRVVLAMVMLPVLFAWWAPGPRVLTQLAAAYLIGVTISFGFGILHGPEVTTNRYNGLSEQPTAFGYASLFAISLLPYLWDAVRPSRRWLLALGFLACLGTTWLSGSRTSLAVILLMALVYPLAARSWKLMGLVSLAGIIGIANLDRILGADGGNALSRLIGRGGARGSDQARTEGLLDGINTFRGHPVFGAGWSFETILAHNIYVQVAAAMGVVGLVAFGIYLWGVVRPLRTLPKPFNRLAYPALVYVISGPITPNVGSRYVSVTLALGLAAAAYFARAERHVPIGSGRFITVRSHPAASR